MLRLRVARQTALLVIAAWVLVGCPSKTDSTKTSIQNAADPQWVFQANPNHDIALVFIHGIFGDTLGTWTNPAGESFFSYINKNPALSSKVDIFAFGYTSSMFKPGSLSVNEAANILHEKLQFYGVLKYRTIVFVAHSMGGLVTMRYLISNPDVRSKVPLLVFFATPQEGAQITTIADKVINNPALADMFGADRNSFLQQLDTDWKKLASHPHMVCAYEKVETHGVMVVPWSSSTRFCDEPGIAIGGADHLSIVKPDRPAHDSVVVLVNAMERRITGAQVAAKLETPDFSIDGDHLVYTLGAYSPRSVARLLNSGGSKLSYDLALRDPYLNVMPYPTPREIPAKGSELLIISLQLGARASEYRFVLKSDASPDQAVYVQVPDMARFLAGEAKLLASTMSDLSAAFSSPEAIKVMGSESDSGAERKVVELVKKSASKAWPELSDFEQSIVAADVLTANNWPQLAVVALRDGEHANSQAVSSPAIQRLAGVVAHQSAVTKIFTSAPTPTLSRNDISREIDLLYLVPPEGRQSAMQVANAFRNIPSLKAYGLTLRGDLYRVSGDTLKAMDFYRSAEEIKPSTQTKYRLEAVDNLSEHPNSNNNCEVLSIGKSLPLERSTADPTKRLSDFDVFPQPRLILSSRLLRESATVDWFFVALQCGQANWAVGESSQAIARKYCGATHALRNARFSMSDGDLDRIASLLRADPGVANNREPLIRVVETCWRSSHVLITANGEAVTQ